MWGDCLEGVGRLFGGCQDALWMLWRGCLEGMGCCLVGVGKLSGGCGEAFWKVWGGCLEGVGRLSRVGLCIVSRYIECIDTLVMIWLTIYQIKSIDLYDMYQNIFLAIK